MRTIEHSMDDLAYSILIEIKEEIFPKLCKEYGITPTLHTPETFDEYIAEEEGYVGTDDLINEIIQDKIEDNLIVTKYTIDETNKFIYRMYVPLFNIEKLVMTNLDLENKSTLNLDGLLDFLELSLRHEFGYILYQNDYIKKAGINAFDWFVNRFNNALDEYSDYCKSAIDTYDNDEDFYIDVVKKYYEIDMVKRINEFAGIHVPDFISKELFYKHQIEISE